MTTMDFLAIFLNSGVRTVEELWQWHPNACEHLHRTRRLESVVHLLGLDQTIAVQAEPPGFYLARCQNAGCFEVWRDIDPAMYRQALRHGFLEGIAAQVPFRPLDGYPTTGGPVRTTAQLIVARILEFAGVSFQTNMHLRAGNRAPGWAYYPIEFVLAKPTRYVMITSGESAEAASIDRRRGRWLKRLLRNDPNLRKLKLNGEVAVLDGNLLRSAGGLSAFVSHVHVRLSQAGIVSQDLPIDLRQCIRFDAAGEPLSHDGRGG